MGCWGGGGTEGRTDGRTDGWRMLNGQPGKTSAGHTAGVRGARGPVPHVPARVNIFIVNYWGGAWARQVTGAHRCWPSLSSSLRRLPPPLTHRIGRPGGRGRRGGVTQAPRESGAQAQGRAFAEVGWEVQGGGRGREAPVLSEPCTAAPRTAAPCEGEERFGGACPESLSLVSWGCNDGNFCRSGTRDFSLTVRGGFALSSPVGCGQDTVLVSFSFPGALLQAALPVCWDDPLEKQPTSPLCNT